MPIAVSSGSGRLEDPTYAEWFLGPGYVQALVTMGQTLNTSVGEAIRIADGSRDYQALRRLLDGVQATVSNPRFFHWTLTWLETSSERRTGMRFCFRPVIPRNPGESPSLRLIVGFTGSPGGMDGWRGFIERFWLYLSQDFRNWDITLAGQPAMSRAWEDYQDICGISIPLPGLRNAGVTEPPMERQGSGAVSQQEAPVAPVTATASEPTWNMVFSTGQQPQRPVGLDPGRLVVRLREQGRADRGEWIAPQPTLGSTKKPKAKQIPLQKAAKEFVEELGIPRMKKMADRLL